MTPAAPLFTLAQMAAALGMSIPGVQKRLANVPPQGRVFVRGQQAHGWALGQLPAAMQDELVEVARRCGCRDTVQLLSAPHSQWQPSIDGAPVKLSEIAEHCLADATRLQRALLPSLRRLIRPDCASAAEIEAQGVAEYKAEFGHSISPGHWRRLADRALSRDGGAEDFGRLEIFLPAKLARRAVVEPGYTAAGLHLQNLRRALSNVRQPSQPTAAELTFIFTQTFDEMQWLIDEGHEEKRARRLVLRALTDSGVRMAKSPAALEKAFIRKLARWQAGGCKPSALADGRTLPREDARLKLPDEDREVLIARAVERGGRISQAWRDVKSTGELSPGIASRYIANPKNKSYVPPAVREEIKFDVAQLADLHHGPRQAKLNGAWIPRDHSDHGPGDWFQGDDCTLPVYYWEETPEGIRAMRGQFLPLIDCKTGYILGFALHS